MPQTFINKGSLSKKPKKPKKPTPPAPAPKLQQGKDVPGHYEPAPSPVRPFGGETFEESKAKAIQRRAKYGNPFVRRITPPGMPGYNRLQSLWDRFR